MDVSTVDEQHIREKRIIRQVEYYFGDINLGKDDFLKNKMQEDDGWVSMDVILTFNSLKRITKDRAAIRQALRTSSSELIEVNEDVSKIRRRPSKPVPDKPPERQDIDARTAYVRGFPEDTTFVMLMNFFEQYGKIEAMTMHRSQPGNSFKGTVFVTFGNINERDAFLVTEGIGYQDNELIKMTKEDYIRHRKEKAWKRRQERIQKRRKKMMAGKEEEKREEPVIKGAVLYIKGLPKDITFRDIKNYFGNFGNVAWVQLAKRDEKTLVRFKEAEAESALNKAKAANNGRVIIRDCEVDIGVLRGEEETEYGRGVMKCIADHKRQSYKKRCQNRKRKLEHQSHQQGTEQIDGGGSRAKKGKR